MSKTLKEKLKINKGSILVVNGPESYLKQIGYSNPTNQTNTVVHLFVQNQRELKQRLSKTLKAVDHNTVFWISYPKKSSTIKTDITRDHGWESIKAAGFTAVSQVSVDDTWSALRFKKIGRQNEKSRSTTLTNIKITVQSDQGKRNVEVPKELRLLFKKHKKEKDFFDSLSYTNRKEYVVWVTSAKKEETRERRLVETIKKLAKGLKNPSQK